MKSLALLILRLVGGGLMAIHAIPKLIGGEGTGERMSDQQKAVLGDSFVTLMEHGGHENTKNMVAGIGVGSPGGTAWLLTLTELLGGLALILGIKTRPAAIGLATVQGVAISKVHREQGLVGGYEFNLLLGAVFAAIAVAGPGKISKD